jgi:hypothetical protein
MCTSWQKRGEVFQELHSSFNEDRLETLVEKGIKRDSACQLLMMKVYFSTLIGILKV